MNRAHISSSTLINEKLEEHQISTAKHCPNCHHKIDSQPVRKLSIPFCLCVHLQSLHLCQQFYPLGFGDTCKAQLVRFDGINFCNCKKDWVGLPAGVKFDPTDQEMIEHLEAKVRKARDLILSSMSSYPRSTGRTAYVTPTLRNSQVRESRLNYIGMHMGRNIETVYLNRYIPGFLSFAFHVVIYCMLGLPRHEFCSDLGRGIYSLVLDVLSPSILSVSFSRCGLWYVYAKRIIVYGKLCLP
jgi:hypothetical protein